MLGSPEDTLNPFMGPNRCIHNPREGARSVCFKGPKGLYDLDKGSREAYVMRTNEVQSSMQCPESKDQGRRFFGQDTKNRAGFENRRTRLG